MKDRLVFLRLGVLGLLLVVFLLGLSYQYLGPFQLAALPAATVPGELTVAFLDVGQGDAIYIETPEGIQVLIDGGPDATVLRSLAAVMPFMDKELDLMIATHRDKDHIGGLVDVLERYEVKQLILTKNTGDTTTSEAFDSAVTEEGLDVAYAEAGLVVNLGASTTLTILSPSGDPTNWESNTSSIVAKLTFGETDFLLTGDAPEGIESYLASTVGSTLKSEVLKLGHHGSKTSSIAMFLTVVSPEYAVVSAGRDNSYGHPHPEVVDRVTESGASLVSTAEAGTLVFKSDGERLWVE
jgi:competence protein ComEC